MLITTVTFEKVQTLVIVLVCSESDSELVSDCSSDYAKKDETMKLPTKRKHPGDLDDLPSIKKKIEMSDSELEDNNVHKGKDSSSDGQGGHN